MGSPVLHLDPTNDISINLLSCQKCNRQTTTLWRIPKEDNLPKTTTLREEIITNLLSCDPFFTTDLVTMSSKASLKTKYLSKRLYSCYLCAIPVIEEQRETKMNETNNQILNDLRNIIRNERRTLTHPRRHLYERSASSHQILCFNGQWRQTNDAWLTGLVRHQEEKEQCQNIAKTSPVDISKGFEALLRLQRRFRTLGMSYTFAHFKTFSVKMLYFTDANLFRGVNWCQSLILLCTIAGTKSPPCLIFSSCDFIMCL